MANRYWDLSERERANLTGEQVEKFLAYELMERGVLQVEQPKLEEVQPMVLPTRRVFMLTETNAYGGSTNLGIGFETIEQAEQAREVICLMRESPYNGTVHVRRPRNLGIISEELPIEDVVMNAKAMLEENGRREKANAAARSEYSAACEAVAAATADVWGDWRRCQEAEGRRQKIRDTFAEYLRMTEGDEIMARNFLAKAFPLDEIAEAVPVPAETLP
jgi:hypothetical protein